MPVAKFGDRLRLAMGGMMQTELIRKATPLLEARGMRLTKSKLSQYVNNVNTPDGDMIELLAEVLDVDPAWLAGFSEKEKPVPGTEDGLDEVLVKLLVKLTPEETGKVIAFAQGLVAAREDAASPRA